MVILPQNPSTGNEQLQAGVAFLAWCYPAACTVPVVLSVVWGLLAFDGNFPSEEHVRMGSIYHYRLKK